MASLCLDLNLSCAGTGSAETPRMSVSTFAKAVLRREKSIASLVHPGVSRFWIEIEHELAPGEVAERDGSVAGSGQIERGSLRARVKLIGHTPSFRRFPYVIVPSQNTHWRERGRWRRGLLKSPRIRGRPRGYDQPGQAARGASAVEIGCSPAAAGASAASDNALRGNDVRRVLRFRLLLAFFARHQKWIWRSVIGIGVLCMLVAAGFLTLWWRLSSGPIQLDIATPWLASAIEENFGSNHHVAVGGTQIERTENGGTAVRIRDIVVRDADGTVVASAPKAEVRVSGAGLLSGRLRAESLNLVGAEMAVRIEQDGQVTVFAGADKRPIATASVPGSAATLLRAAQEKANVPAASAAVQPNRAASRARRVCGPLSWIDGISQSGLDGHDLRELGLKNGNLTVDDERTGKHWKFEDINLSVERAHGGVEVSVGSDNPERPWGLVAAVMPTRQGYPPDSRLKLATWPPVIFSWSRASTKVTCGSICRCPQASTARSDRTDCRRTRPHRSSPRPARSDTQTTTTAASHSIASSSN